MVGDVHVCAYASNGEIDACAKPSAFSGEYTIEGLAAGEYKVGFSSTGLDYLDQYYNDKSLLAEAEPVSVAAGQTTSEVNAELHTAGGITGRVTNVATGAPIEGIQVCVEPSVVVDCERTGANGEYAFSELASGEYQLEFSPDELDYLYHRLTDVPVTAGHVTANGDVGLTEGGRITGRVTDASTGTPMEGVEACAHEVDGDITQCGTANASGEYTITMLNGRYTVEFHSPTGGYLAQFYGGPSPIEHGRSMVSPSQELSVTAPATVSGIDVALQPGVFQEPGNTVPPVVSGTPAVGSTLSCAPGAWSGDPAPTFEYVWLRDGAPIAGATEDAYIPQAADEGLELSCKVYATNAAGSQIDTGHAVSASVLIGPAVVTGPASGGPGTTTARPTTDKTATSDLTPTLTAVPLVTLMTSRLTVSGGVAPVHVACSRAACRGLVELVVQAREQHHKGRTAVQGVTLVLAAGSFSLAEGKSRTIVLHLTIAGRKMLAHASTHHPIAAKLTLSVKGGKAATRSVLAV